MATAAPSIITKGSFTLTDRIKFQQDCIRRGDYTKIGKLTCILREGQRSTIGFSQERSSVGGIDVFGKWRRTAWCALTLDWLNHNNAPILALSRDRNDLLLPFRMNKLPDIPDPRWNGFTVAPAADCVNPEIPRIPQLLAGCPVVGDRVTGTITDRISGKMYAIFHPLKTHALQVMCGRGKDSGFGRISFMTDPATGLQGAFLIHVEPDNEGKHDAYFVGGCFYLG